VPFIKTNGCKSKNFINSGRFTFCPELSVFLLL
jgi:hypothetical protein